MSNKSPGIDILDLYFPLALFYHSTKKSLLPMSEIIDQECNSKKLFFADFDSKLVFLLFMRIKNESEIGKQKKLRRIFLNQVKK